METPPPDPTRYITANDSKGHSFFSTAFPDSVLVGADLGGAVQRLVYTSARPPASLTAEADLKAYNEALTKPKPFELVRSDGGTNVWEIDLPPGSASPMHRTVSVDVVVVTMGSVVLETSNGETRTVKAGDVVIQRSTLHKWRNGSEGEWARMVGVMTQCQGVVTEEGGVLGEEFQED